MKRIHILPAILLLTFSCSHLSAQNTDSLTIIPLAGEKTIADTSETREKKAPRPARPDNFWRRVSVGGMVGFQFGSITGIDISPEVKVRVWDELYVGTGFIYQYYRYKDWYVDTRNNSTVDFTSNVIGGRIYLRYYLASFFDNFLGNIFVHTEYEYLSYIHDYKYDPLGTFRDPYWNYYSPGREIIEIHSFFVGGGYRQPLSNRVFFDFLILFNLNDSYYSPYSNPIFRLGVGVGI
jgi:hypothetical protein